MSVLVRVRLIFACGHVFVVGVVGGVVVGGYPVRRGLAVFACQLLPC